MSLMGLEGIELPAFVQCRLKGFIPGFDGPFEGTTKGQDGSTWRVAAVPGTSADGAGQRLGYAVRVD